MKAREPSKHASDSHTLNLRVGEVVEVRPVHELIATLDKNGTLDALPLMPEMLVFSGKRFRVFKRADKVHDLAERMEMRRMDNTVLLEDVRCSGGNHGGCEAGCQILWKEAWLRRAPSSNSRQRDGIAINGHLRDDQGSPYEMNEHQVVEQLVRNTTRSDSQNTGEQRFCCQATEMHKASSFLHPWDVRQYIKDIRFGNVGILEAITALAVWLFNIFQRVRGGLPYPFIQGRRSKSTPRSSLDLVPGELVRIKSKDEIEETLDGRYRTRGLWFDPEMVKYCGRKFKVLKRVHRLIDEKTGRMVNLSNDCIVLEGVTCLGDYHQFYSQNEYLFWREAWLERVQPDK